MGWKHYQTVDHPKRKPQVGSGPVWYPCNNSSFQISIFQIHQIVNISYFPQFNLSFEKKISFPKCPKITEKFTQTAKQQLWFQRCLKSDRDIGRKAVSSEYPRLFKVADQKARKAIFVYGKFTASFPFINSWHLTILVSYNCKKQMTSVFNASVLLLMINFVIALSKFTKEPLNHFDNVMMQFIINKRTDA